MKIKVTLLLMSMVAAVTWIRLNPKGFLFSLHSWLGNVHRVITNLLSILFSVNSGCLNKQVFRHESVLCSFSCVFASLDVLIQCTLTIAYSLLNQIFC